MNQQEWIEMGVDKGWCAPMVCETHEGLPMTEAERLDWEEGFDPCLFALRLLGEGEQVETL